MSNRIRLTKPIPRTFVTEHPGTYWNGQPTPARRSGWRKVTEGHGGPRWPHRSVYGVEVA